MQSSPPPLHFSPVNHRSVVSVARGFFPGTVKIVRIALSKSDPRFSVISFQHGYIEGHLTNGQLLLERFEFGWQMIDISQGPLFDRATLLSHGIAASVVTALDPGAPRAIPLADACSARDPLCEVDSGPPHDIELLRQKREYSRDATGPVVVRSNYGIVGWFGAGGGEDLFKKSGGSWKRIGGGGGAFCSALDLHAYGVPVAIARELLTGSFACQVKQNRSGPVVPRRAP